MITSIIYIICGIAIVLWGADKLTDGSVSVARRFNVPEIVIGMTIVAFGTSMPELCVSMVSAMDGSADMATGNVVGSNIFNVFLIIGVCAMIAPMAVTRKTVKRDLPFATLSGAMLLVMLINGSLDWIDGIIMLAAFAAYMYYTMRTSLRDKDIQEEIEDDVEDTHPQGRIKGILTSPWFAIPIGLVALVEGSDIFVEHATNVARELKVSEAVIGLTIMGFGTSLPEFATSVVAATKGNTSMAMGNVMGSFVFNILLILGLTSCFTELAPAGITWVDLGVMFFGIVIMWLFSYTKYTMERWEGLIMTILFIAYMTWLSTTI